MSRQSNIKWRIQDERELAQVARDFNRKLDRLVENNPKNASALPKFYNAATDRLESYIAVENLKTLITSRADYNRIVNMLKRFMREGAEEIIDAPENEYGTRVTKWQAQEMNRLASAVNRGKAKRLAEVEKLEMETGSGKLGYTLGDRFGMGLASKVQLAPTKAFVPSQVSRDINFKFGSLLKQRDSGYYKNKDAALKANFIRELERNYAKKDIKDVIKAIKETPDDVFVLKFEAHGDGFEIAYPMENNSDEYEGFIEELKAYWITE